MRELDNQNPLNLTVDAGLDLALTGGWTTWRSLSSNREPAAVLRWLKSRLPEGVDPEDIEAPLLALIGETAPEDRAMAAADLAELFEADDPGFAAMLWESVLEAGKETSDGELVFEGASRLAGLEEDYGDPLSAAEFHIEFLNWRRQDEHSSDPESVLTAFDEVVRLAAIDGASRAEAHFTYLQAQFLRAVESESPAAEVGDWAPAVPAFAAWDSE